jgi:mannose-1-phosphate guanylyltransferase
LVDYRSRIAYCESFAQRDIFSSGKKGKNFNQRSASGGSRIALTLHSVQNLQPAAASRARSEASALKMAVVQSSHCAKEGYVTKDRAAQDEDIVVLIMAGGGGTRFWPLSNQKCPKQFMNLFHDRTLLQQSFDRVSGLVSADHILILTNERYMSLIREQLPEIPEANIIGEPIARDTAAAIALGAVLCRSRFGNPTMVVLTADHLISPIETFQRTILSAVYAATEEGYLYTFGIVPTFPATGYGYLEQGEMIKADDGIEHFQLLRFKEKPDLETARSYVASGQFLWNSGMFVWTVETILNEIKRHLPDHAKALLPLAEVDGTDEWDPAIRNAFEALPKISIDFGVMEKSKHVRTVRAEFEWSDVGGWMALEKFLSPDGAGNVACGCIKCQNASGNIVFCKDDKETVALVGVDNLVVVRAGDKTLVVHRDHTEDVKKLVERLQLDKD